MERVTICILLSFSKLPRSGLVQRKYVRLAAKTSQWRDVVEPYELNNIIQTKTGY